MQQVSKLAAVAAFAFLFVLSATTVEAATLSLSPDTGVYTAGGTFTARVVINTSGETINAADATLSFKPSELSVVSISKGSIFNLWTAEPSFSNSAGTISFSGGSPTGYSGGAGTVLNITFRAATAGTGRVSFTNGSVLAADGRGTNVLSGMSGGTYTIQAAGVQPEPEVIEYVAPPNTPSAPAVRSSSHPDPASWYQNSTAELSWSLPSGITAVRTLLDGNSGGVPTRVYDTPIDSISIPELSEGVQYFHLQFRNSDGWGRVAHYRLAVDTAAPTSFEISLPEGADTSKPEQTLVLDVKDATSPVRRYLVQLDGAEPYEYIDETGSSTITLPPLEPGYHTVIIEAFDAAGNSIVDSFSFTVTSFDKPVFTDYPDELNEGVIPVIKGVTKGTARVIVTLMRDGMTPVEQEVVADENGVFTYIPDGALSLGVYTLQAVAIDSDGAQSEPSDTIRIAVQEPGYIQIGGFLVSVLSIFVPLLALLVLLGLGIWYVIYRIRRLRRRVALEADEALAIMKKEFGELSAVLATEEDNLVQSRKTKKLTKAEADLLEHLRSELKDTENRIEKEITDVTELVHQKHES